MTYRGYDIIYSKSGGKAGRGRNKTASVQVFDKPNAQGSMQMLRFFRYTVASHASRCRALDKAKEFIDKLPPA